MSEKPIWPKGTRVEKEQKSGQRPRKRRKNNNKAEGLKEKKMKAQSA